MKEYNAIEVRNMSKSFKVQKGGAKTLKERLAFGRQEVTYNEVLKNINLDIKKGETVALIGTNGSGKSTLLKLMTKIIYPNKGTVETQGKLTSLLELGAGFHQDFTGRENIYFNAAIFGLTEKEINARIDEIIEFSELGHFIDEPIRTYSSGMYMRLAFSIAINVDAEVLLIDEILAVGDAHFQDKCYAKLKEYREDKNKTVVIVSHSLAVVRDLCDRAIWIYKGEFKLDGPPVYVIEEYLNQIAIDNQEERKKDGEEGGSENHGALYIDVPKDFARVSLGDPTFQIQGWEVSNCRDAVLEIKVGDKPVNDIFRVPRQDVYDAYSEIYGGFMDTDTIGWATNVPTEEFLGDVSGREVRITVTLKDDKGNEMGERSLTIYIDKE